MRLMRRPAILACLLALSACGSSEDEAVVVTLRHEGEPASWGPGDRIRVEGKVRRTSSGHYFITRRAGSGDRAQDDCLALEPEESSLASRMRLRLSANGERIISVTGHSTKRYPIVPIPGGGQHSGKLCSANLKVERVDLRGVS